VTTGLLETWDACQRHAGMTLVPVHSSYQSSINECWAELLGTIQKMFAAQVMNFETDTVFLMTHQPEAELNCQYSSLLHTVSSLSLQRCRMLLLQSRRRASMPSPAQSRTQQRQAC
jgi:hypothetical protein